MTGAVLVFEMTRNYGLMLPLLVCVVIATAVGHWLSEGTIYTLKLIRRHDPRVYARDAHAAGPADHEPDQTPDR